LSKALQKYATTERGVFMEVQLPEKVAEIVRAKVVAGGYANAAAFISDIVLRADEFDQLKLERLRTEVGIGLDEISRGEVVEFDLEDIFSEEEK
jgi:Arc/MetJ-type ribon-helix-helix transcriptional regulator